MKGFWAMSAACLLVAGTAAHADMAGMKVAEDPMVFKNLDTNQDGQVSRDEAESVVGLSQGFDSADSNKDGQLNPAELTVALPAPNEGE